MAAQAQWHLSGDYFENCNCSVVCPCLVSKNAPLTSRPTEGVCDVAFIFHIESGSFDARRSMGSMWHSRCTHRDQWQMGIGQLLLTSIKVPTISRLKLWVRFSLAQPADQWPNWRR